jgi:hypothetical protein
MGNYIQDCHDKSMIQQTEDCYHQQIGPKLKKLVKCCIWSITVYGVEIWTLWKVDMMYLESFKSDIGGQQSSVGPIV